MKLAYMQAAEQNKQIFVYTFYGRDPSVNVAVYLPGSDRVFRDSYPAKDAKDADDIAQAIFAFGESLGFVLKSDSLGQLA